MSKGEISDGLENTILFTEITDSDILWSEPATCGSKGWRCRNGRPTPTAFLRPAGQPRAQSDRGRWRPAVYDSLRHPGEVAQALLTIAGGEADSRISFP